MRMNCHRSAEIHPDPVSPAREIVELVCIQNVAPPEGKTWHVPSAVSTLGSYKLACESASTLLVKQIMKRCSISVLLLLLFESASVDCWLPFRCSFVSFDRLRVWPTAGAINFVVSVLLRRLGWLYLP